MSVRTNRRQRPIVPGPCRLLLGAMVAAAAAVCALPAGSPGGLGVDRADAAPACARVYVIGVRGSGEDAGLGDQVGNFVANLLPEMRGAGTQVRRFPLDYPASGSKLTLAGGLFKLPAGYHRSVVHGKQELSRQLNAIIARCDPGITRIVLGGYSQGAQVVADVLQATSLTTVRTWIGGMVLFGDPYFNPFSPGGAGNHPRKLPFARYGILGARPRYSLTFSGRIRSYCDRHDPICQGTGGVWNLNAHSRYNHRGEAADAGRWLSTQLRRDLAAHPWPPAEGTIVRDRASGAAWMVAPGGVRNWIPTGGDYLCFTGRGAPVRSVSAGSIAIIRDAVGVHARCSAPSRPPAPPTPPAPVPVTPVVPVVPSTPVVPPSRQVTLTVANKVTNGATQMREDVPVYLSTAARNFCRRDGCMVPGTERQTGGTYGPAVCQLTGARTTNGNDADPSDDRNPGLFTSTRWYGIRLANGSRGYVSEVWISPSQRGGLGLPGC